MSNAFNLYTNKEDLYTDILACHGFTGMANTYVMTPEEDRIMGVITGKTGRLYRIVGGEVVVPIMIRSSKACTFKPEWLTGVSGDYMLYNVPIALAEPNIRQETFKSMLRIFGGRLFENYFLHSKIRLLNHLAGAGYVQPINNFVNNIFYAVKHHNEDNALDMYRKLAKARKVRRLEWFKGMAYTYINVQVYSRMDISIMKTSDEYLGSPSPDWRGPNDDESYYTTESHKTLYYKETLKGEDIPLLLKVG